ncbi:MAG: hypothetical protein NTW25_14935 [Candidatus Kapabacteria bacterium]|nr:hypothetical protein [Candidatus Kapabacteria bacterium]
MIKILILLVITLTFSSCSLFQNHNVYIEGYRPAQYNIGLKPNIKIIESKGSLRALNDEFTYYLIHRGRALGYKLEDNLKEGIEIKNKRNNPIITGLDNRIVDKNEFFMNFEIVDKNEDYFTKIEKEKYFEKIVKDKKEVEIEKVRDIKVSYIRTVVVVQITLAKISKFILDQKEYSQSIEWRMPQGPNERNERYVEVLKNIANRFIYDISPRLEKYPTELDYSEEAQEPILNEMLEGKTSTFVSISKLKNYISSNPKSSSAYLNLAIVYDYMQDYEKALLNYDKAFRHNPSYYKFKIACEDRIRNYDDINEYTK